MISALGHHLNKTVFVAIPPIFGDVQPRTCILKGIEVSGVWLVSRELAGQFSRLIHDIPPPPIFVPFTQIACLWEPELIERALISEQRDSVPPSAKKRAASVRPKKKLRVT